VFFIDEMSRSKSTIQLAGSPVLDALDESALGINIAMSYASDLPKLTVGKNQNTTSGMKSHSTFFMLSIIGL
jgi:hypothetical protein